jgi:hypothetical protein
VSRSTTSMGSPQLGQRHSGCSAGTVDVCDSFFDTVARRRRGTETGERSGLVGEEAEVADADEALGEEVK